jgi:hypothetical protein
VANLQIDEENNLDIFEMSVGTNEPTKEVVKKVEPMSQQKRL